MAEVETPHPGMRFGEFVALVAALMAITALGIDTMLPALQQIGTALGVTAPNENQWILSAYMLGFGISQIVYGTLVDRYGRRPILLGGLAGFVLFSLVVAFARSFETLLLARCLQGAAAAGARVVATAVVRDCYAGRLMARVTSLALLVFLGVPILAPSLGQVIILIEPWRWIFIALAMFGALVLVWSALRLPETLRAADRTPIAPLSVLRIFGHILKDRHWLGYSAAITLISGSLFGFLNSTQQIFIDVFKKPLLFSAIFALIASSIAIASLVNARLVERLGMRLLSHSALLGFIVIACIHVAIVFLGFETLWSFTLLQSLMMFCFGLMMGNFGAISMEAMGHMAGTAAAAQGFITTVGAALIGFLIGQSYNGTDLPLTLGFMTCSLLTLVIILATERGKLCSENSEFQDTDLVVMH